VLLLGSSFSVALDAAPEEVEALVDVRNSRLLHRQAQAHRGEDGRCFVTQRFGVGAGTGHEHHPVSRRGESHPPALAEPGVNLSAHRAPIVQLSGRTPQRQWANSPGWRLATARMNWRALVLWRRLRLRLAHPAPPTSPRLAAKQARTTLPLRSSSITEPSSLLRVGPPLCPASLLSPSQICCLGFSLQTTGRRPKPLHWPGRPIGATGSRVPHESPDHARATIHAGHPPGQSAGSRQANPGATTRPRFRTSSIRFRHFNGGIAFARLRDPHLTRSTARRLRDAQHPGS